MFARGVKTGVAGLSIEDSTGDAAKPLYDRHTRSSGSGCAQGDDADSSGVLLTALRGVPGGAGRSDLVIDRLTAIGGGSGTASTRRVSKTKDQISAVVKAVHPKRSIFCSFAGLSVAEAAELGVRRISVGGSLVRVAWAGFMKAARRDRDKGTFADWPTATRAD